MRRLFEFLIFSLAAFLIVQAVLMHLGTPGTRSDLDILLLAGQRFSEGHSVYQLTDFAEHTKPPLLSPLLALLAHVPIAMVRRFWDLMNLVLPFLVLTLWVRIWTPGLNPWRDRHFWLKVSLCLILLRGFWRTEMDFGQFNLFLVALQLLAFRCATNDRLLLAGGISTFCVLLKPSQIFFLPWFINGMPKITRSRVAFFLTGSLALILFTTVLYLLYRPASDLLYAHLDWLSFMKTSTEKHIARLDNFSIPSLLARQGFAWAASPLVTLAGVGLVLLLSVLRLPHPKAGFQVIVGLNLSLSVMTWWQNFVILIPAAFELLNFRLWRKHPFWAFLGCACLALPNLVKPAWIGGPALEQFWKQTALPLWLANLAIVILLVLSSRPNAPQERG
ncbi:DUF2029 domain-containing protein [bacterium]|nr:DUF2029 domain-containing protein [bacterium]